MNIDNLLRDKVLEFYSKRSEPFIITVNGVSMEPLLLEGDIITVQPMRDYNIGDIIVFKYREGDLLVHRIVCKSENNGGDRLFCKGDNAFRLEDIVKEQIMGKVLAGKRGEDIVNLPQKGVISEKIAIMSHMVNREYVRCGHQREPAMSTYCYQVYSRVVLTGELNTPVYVISKSKKNCPLTDSERTVLSAIIEVGMCDMQVLSELAAGLTESEIATLLEGLQSKGVVEQI